MKTVMCAVARTENIYLEEWCKFYLDMGFEHIYLFDNNDDTDPDIRDSLSQEILDKMTIFNVHGQSDHSAQTNWYLQFYSQYGNTFDWCAFFDIDEFLFGIDNINEFLSQDKFKGKEQILIKWKLFGDDGYIERDMSIPVHEFFKIDNVAREPINKLLGKAMIAGHLPNGLPADMNCHFCRGLSTCYPSGRVTQPKRYLIDWPVNEIVYLNHYRTKTLKEFLMTKLVRQTRIYSSTPVTLSQYYFKVNEWTPEKQAFVDKWFAEHPEVAGRN